MKGQKQNPSEVGAKAWGTILTAYEKGQYVDSITTSDPETRANFYKDFEGCEIREVSER